MKSEYFLNKENFRKSFITTIEETYAIDFKNSTIKQQYAILGEMIRKHNSHNWCMTSKNSQKQTWYFSYEFSLEKLMENNIVNSGLKDIVEETLLELNINLNELLNQEKNKATGLPLCFLDSSASLNLSVNANTFRHNDNNIIWEIKKDKEVYVPFYGTVDFDIENNKLIAIHNPSLMKAVSYDIPVIGYKNGVVNTLRQWSTNVEFNSDEESLLKQNYFYISSGVQSILEETDVFQLSDKMCFQINDSNSALLIPELIRLLIDKYNMCWESAWDVTVKTCSYTINSDYISNWNIELFKTVLPRIYLIIEEIDLRLKNTVNNISIISDVINLNNLAFSTCFSINGISKTQTEMILQSNFYKGKILNITSGITHRRWCLNCNKELVEILNEYCANWINNPYNLKLLLKEISKRRLQKKFRNMKLENKKLLADKILKEKGIIIDCNSIFDIQFNDVNESNRQILNILNIIYTYSNLKENNEFKENTYPQTYIFKKSNSKISKLIEYICDMINTDSDVNKIIKVLVLDNSYEDLLVSSCDISEQLAYNNNSINIIKFMMNASITIGVDSGLNNEINELVKDDIFIITSSNDYDSKYLSTMNSILEMFDLKELINNNNVLNDLNSYIMSSRSLNELYKDEVSWYKKCIMNTAMSSYFSTDRSIIEYNNKIWNLNKLVVDWK